MLLLAFGGCDVHEFPVDDSVKVPFLLHLDFNTEMPLYKEVTSTRSGDEDTKAVAPRHDIRYIVKAFRPGRTRAENRIPDTTFVFTKSDISDLNYTAQLELPEGTYEFKVWADYVDAGSVADKYYDTHEFSEIILADRKNHPGSNDYRDAFRGYVTADVTNPEYYAGAFLDKIDNQATVEMRRPMGKFKFVSNDVDALLNRVLLQLKEQGMLKAPAFVVDIKASPEQQREQLRQQLLEKIKLGEFTVLFRYNVFMPCSFNMFTDKPADSWTGMTFKSNMHLESNNEMTLGYDYIFVNGSETKLSISVEVYNTKGQLMSSSNPILVPIVRSKMTLVKGAFLTSKATEGVTINPSYDGDDYNIEITFK